MIRVPLEKLSWELLNLPITANCRPKWMSIGKLWVCCDSQWYDALARRLLCQLELFSVIDAICKCTSGRLSSRHCWRVPRPKVITSSRQPLELIIQKRERRSIHSYLRPVRQARLFYSQEFLLFSIWFFVRKKRKRENRPLLGWKGDPLKIRWKPATSAPIRLETDRHLSIPF